MGTASLHRMGIWLDSWTPGPNIDLESLRADSINVAVGAASPQSWVHADAVGIASPRRFP